jgi:TonB family protein
VKVENAPPPVIETTPAPPPQEYKIEPPAPPAPPKSEGPTGIVRGAKCSVTVKPEYPRKALQENINAEVTVHITIDPSGNATDAKIVSNNVGDPAMRRLFNSASIAAAKQFKCEQSSTGYIAEVPFGFRVTDN